MKLDTLRQSGIIPNESLSRSSVTVIGVGGIGSATAECLAKMGVPEMVMYDDDVVDSHNCANQGYFIPEIGYKKVDALRARLSEGTGCSIDGRFGRVDRNTDFQTPVVVSAVDSMTSRDEIWKAVKSSISTKYYIDGRMGARAGYVFFVNLSDQESIKDYEATLFPDDEAVEEPCTERATIFCGWSLGSIIASQVSKTIINTDDEMNDVPNRVIVDLKHFRML